MPCTIEVLLGAGGQGEVYKAELAGEAVAVKWFFPQMATPEQRASMELLIKICRITFCCCIRKVCVTATFRSATHFSILTTATF
jgi:hypothetical protein